MYGGRSGCGNGELWKKKKKTRKWVLTYGKRLCKLGTSGSKIKTTKINRKVESNMKAKVGSKTVKHIKVSTDSGLDYEVIKLRKR
jgi:hypothetical protein